MPFTDNDKRASAEYKKHEQKIMEDARKRDLRKKFAAVGLAEKVGISVVYIGDNIVTLGYDKNLRKIGIKSVAKRSTEKDFKNMKELEDVIQLYEEEIINGNKER